LSICIPANYMTINPDIPLSARRSPTLAKRADDRRPEKSRTASPKDD
jgi:hypothetical protein